MARKSRKDRRTRETMDAKNIDFIEMAALITPWRAAHNIAYALTRALVRPYRPYQKSYDEWDIVENHQDTPNTPAGTLNVPSFALRRLQRVPGRLTIAPVEAMTSSAIEMYRQGYVKNAWRLYGNEIADVSDKTLEERLWGYAKEKRTVIGPRQPKAKPQPERLFSRATTQIVGGIPDGRYSEANQIGRRAAVYVVHRPIARDKTQKHEDKVIVAGEAYAKPTQDEVPPPTDHAVAFEQQVAESREKDDNRTTVPMPEPDEEVTDPLMKIPAEAKEVRRKRTLRSFPATVPQPSSERPASQTPVSQARPPKRRTTTATFAAQHERPVPSPDKHRENSGAIAEQGDTLGQSSEIQEHIPPPSFGPIVDLFEEVEDSVYLKQDIPQELLGKPLVEKPYDIPTHFSTQTTAEDLTALLAEETSYAYQAIQSGNSWIIFPAEGVREDLPSYRVSCLDIRAGNKTIKGKIAFVGAMNTPGALRIERGFLERAYARHADQVSKKIKE